MMKISDSFDLVMLEESFAQEISSVLSNHPLFTQDDLAILQKTATADQINTLLENRTAIPLEHGGQVVGCVKRAHEHDLNLKADVMFENLAAKASGVLALRHLLWNNELEPALVDYIIETSEEAAGDMNQRGGGNFAKAIGEVAGCINATGSDTRSFCAGPPAHGIVNAIALVKAGDLQERGSFRRRRRGQIGHEFARSHQKKEVPVLEDLLGAFAVLISEDDGASPILRTDAIGRHRVGTGSSPPQAVTTALVTEPLDRIGLSITDIDKYSVEMQNPEITVPAGGAGDVPLANYRMIAALGVRQGVLERAELNDFVAKHGLTGWAPTQGHIPPVCPIWVLPAREFWKEK